MNSVDFLNVRSGSRLILPPSFSPSSGINNTTSNSRPRYGKHQFDAHIQHVRSSCHSVLSCITYSFRNLRSRSAYINLFYAFIFSRLTYSSCIWSGSSSHLISKLECVQNRFLRFLNWRLSLPKEFSCTILRERFNIPSLKESFKKLDLKLFLKLVPDPGFEHIRLAIYNRPGRHLEKYFVPLLRLSKCQSFFFYRAAKLANIDWFYEVLWPNFIRPFLLIFYVILLLFSVGLSLVAECWKEQYNNKQTNKHPQGVAPPGPRTGAPPPNPRVSGSYRPPLPPPPQLSGLHALLNSLRWYIVLIWYCIVM